MSPGGDETEMRDLLASLRWTVLASVRQRNRRPDPSRFFGKGKLDEAREVLADWTKRLIDERAAGLSGEDAGLPADASDAIVDAVFDADERARTGKSRGQARGRKDAVSKRQWGTRKRSKKPSRRQRALVVRPTVVVDAELKASQLAGIENALGGAEVFDRTRVILEIFQERAQNEEARLQVEAARLRYEMPLVREYIRLAKLGEHPGFMAGGEYGVNQYFDTIQKRATKVNRELEHIGSERAARRKHRRRGGFLLVSLAGYTNAGKSSLMRRLSGENVLVENRMFSTLDTKTARLTFRSASEEEPAGARPASDVNGKASETGAHQDDSSRRMSRDDVAKTDEAQDLREGQPPVGEDRGQGQRPVLVTDTVGFIRDLPPWLIKAFRSTLEEIALSDVIILVVDASDAPEEIADRFQASYQVLLGFERIPTLVVALNKSDLLPSDEERDEARRVVIDPGLVPDDRVVFTSTKTGEGLDRLVDVATRLLADGSPEDPSW